MKIWKLGIIGGGPGGLMTAYQLQKHATHPFETTIFDASPRLGGKIITKRFQQAPLAYEAGAAEIYDYSRVGEDPLRDLILELGLSISPMEGGAIVFDDQIYRDAAELCDLWGPAARTTLERFEQSAKDWMTPIEYYKSDWQAIGNDAKSAQPFEAVLEQISHPAARRYVESFIHSDLATEPSQTNAAYGLQNYLMNDPAYLRLYTIDGGIEQLPQELAKRIAGHARLNHEVVRVERLENGNIGIDIRHQGESSTAEFDFVVVAMPNSAIPAIDWGGEDLAAAMAAHHRHYDYPAHYLRVTILFERPFWRRLVRDSYWMLDAFGGCCLYDESSRNDCSSYGILGWLLGGDAAQSLSELSNEELIRCVLDALPTAMGSGRELFLEGKIHRWVDSVNGMPGGYPLRNLDARHQPEPVRHPNLLVVGDYLFDSTLNGVLDSADFVAEWLASEMEQNAAAYQPSTTLAAT